MFVYFIKCKATQGHNNPVKIGIGVNPEKRITELQTGNPYQLELLAKIPARNRKHAEFLEYSFHKYFSFAHMRGEWFKGKHINIKKAIDHIGDCSEPLETFKRGQSVHGSKKEEKINNISRQLINAHKALQIYDDKVDEDLDLIHLSHLKSVL